MKTKVKSTALFLVIILVIAFLAYSGAYGLTIGDYRIRPFSETVKRGLDLKGGISLVMEIQESNIKREDIDRTLELLSMRVNKMGVSETTIQQEGSKRIRIDIPDRFDTKEVIDTVGKTGKLKFVGPDNSEILTGSDVKDATTQVDQQTGAPIVGLELNDAGAKKFADATQKFLNQQIAIYMDEDMISNPTVQAVINDGKAVITGSKDLAEAKRLASIIKSGALPLTVKTASVKVVGPTLGANAMAQSIKAGVIALIFIFLFMVLYYRVPGLIACLALVLYMVLLLIVYSSIGATLTLSGIAAFLISAGMALDANVLIFERMKEELITGKSIKSVIDAGFHRAMTSVLDSNITTVISGIILYYLGSGAVKGFALTLIIGVLLSMFTAITVSRFLIKLAAKMGILNKITIGTFGVRNVVRR
ncbi:protein translocase subunit SecD [Clostridium sp. SYSU_GA19001]|uniref:protein translocase subunit SecD n=1 Tax=Clostridium caldaquaticum TaxID=2940653 RepID=UPI0020775470|nr:protein translocase subunit SecD [Clostridium caldaquaticum]MCM8710441.1 protein translocase subunit SecD [Clostridium caldaquaticum]